ncbi:MAG: acetaldehyde dehydrogenase (acetylating) [Bacillota bacterium]
MAVDADLMSIQEAREAIRRAADSRAKLASLTQEQVDRIVRSMAEAGRANARALAKMAADETGFGVYEDKITKNLFASERVYEAIRDLKTVGIIRRDPSRRIAEIAEPMGVIIALVPSTNPTSTVIYKSLISMKARNPIVFSPHPAACKCSCQAAQVMADAACAAGAPRGAIQCIIHPTKQATDELMHHPETALILATGGSAMVKAAYSAGKPAYGVGPGNVPAFIERTADIKKAVSDIFASKTFDNGTICASEQAIVTESVIEDQVVEEVRAQGGYFLSDAEAAALARVVVQPAGNINPSIVGRSAATIARLAGITVPEGTRVLIARLAGVGPQYPLSKEKLSPVLAFYVEPDWQAACERCIEILKFGGIGHSLVIHSRNEAVIREFALKKPVFRILVNTPSSQGAIGATTGLDPALTLGCGTWGGSITADNVGPMHLVNVKRVAYDLASENVRGLYEEEIEGRQVGVSWRARQPSTQLSGARPVPSIVGPAAAVDRPVTMPPAAGARSRQDVAQSRGRGELVPGQRAVRDGAGGSGTAQHRSAGLRSNQTRIVSDEEIRAVVDRFLSELGRGGGMKQQ